MSRVFFCFLLILLLACNDQPEVPAGVLPPAKMEAVLWDVIRADVMVNYQAARDTAMNKFARNTELYQHIFSIHHTSKEAFKRSVAYYSSHPALLQTTFDSLYSKASRFTDTAHNVQ